METRNCRAFGAGRHVGRLQGAAPQGICAASSTPWGWAGKFVDNASMNQHAWTIAGGGIGGLAAAVALAREGVQAQVVEQASAWAEVGAGIQLGPNVTRILRDWNLEEELRACASFPDALVVRDAVSGVRLGQLRLGRECVQRYGAPYATIHRADMHALLLRESQSMGVQTRLHHRVTAWTAAPEGGLALSIRNVGASDEGVGALQSEPIDVRTEALLGADGLWSTVRGELLPGEAAPRFSGILAYRALVAQADLPEALRSQVVTVWLGAGMHMVQYPVRGGSHLNVVALVEGPRPEDLQNWDHAANAGHLRRVLSAYGREVQALAEAIAQWRLWPLCDRPPVASADQMARGRVALLGDAAHPMRPFMAQGACMAIEDAATLAFCVATRPDGAIPDLLQHYAALRWQRCARVQQRSIRNGEIFHCTGLMRWGRDWAMRLGGEHLLDVPWLYGHEVPVRQHA